MRKEVGKGEDRGMEGGKGDEVGGLVEGERKIWCGREKSEAMHDDRTKKRKGRCVCVCVCVRERLNEQPERGRKEGRKGGRKEGRKGVRRGNRRKIWERRQRNMRSETHVYSRPRSR